MEFDESSIVERTDDVGSVAGAEPEHLMTLHCSKCNAVSADSLGVCGESKSIDSIMCIRVTNDVLVRDALESTHKGEMANCIFSHLKCRWCNCVVGKVIHAAPSHSAAIRSLFLSDKTKMSCYISDSSSMVAASSVSFDSKPLQEAVHEARQEFEEQSDSMAYTCSRSADISMSVGSRSTN